MGIVDIHCHILPNVDDGPATVEEALEMARRANASGVTDLVVTPHLFHPQFDTETIDVEHEMNELQRALDAEKIVLRLHSGNEVRVGGNVLGELDQGNVRTLGNSRYVLIEFPHQTVPSYTESLFFELQIAGYVPVIAHPERNQQLLIEPERLYRFASAGALSQVTTASVAGHFGRHAQEMALVFLRHRLSQLIASDAHNSSSRAFFWEEAVAVLNKELGVEWTEQFLHNSEAVLKDEVILVDDLNMPKKNWLGKWK